MLGPQPGFWPIPVGLVYIISTILINYHANDFMSHKKGYLIQWCDVLIWVIVRSSPCLIVCLAEFVSSRQFCSPIRWSTSSFWGHQVLVCMIPKLYASPSVKSHEPIITGTSVVHALTHLSPYLYSMHLVLSYTGWIYQCLGNYCMLIILLHLFRVDNRCGMFPRPHHSSPGSVASWPSVAADCTLSLFVVHTNLCV